MSPGGYQFSMRNMATATKLVSVEYEVFGKVQGVFFRKYTQQTATSYGLVGWVKNTNHDTVVGVIQGPENAVSRMEDWLRTKGSPMSSISKLELKNRKDISQVEFPKFNIKGGWKDWLQTSGSPKSRIDRCQFKNEKEIGNVDFAQFEIDRPKRKGKTKKT